MSRTLGTAGEWPPRLAPWILNLAAKDLCGVGRGEETVAGLVAVGGSTTASQPRIEVALKGAQPPVPRGERHQPIAPDPRRDEFRLPVHAPAFRATDT